MAAAHQRLFEMLMTRVRTDRYPSTQLLDRIEHNLTTPDQLVDYTDMLLDKIDEAWYPSTQLLNRVQRILDLSQAAAARGSNGARM